LVNEDEDAGKLRDNLSQHSSRAGAIAKNRRPNWFVILDLQPPTGPYADAAGRRCRKQSRQSTGRPCVGLNGTVVSLPHCEQMARVSVLDEPRCPPPLAPKFETRFALQLLHRLGSFLNCLSWKNICSPEVKTKSAPQSMHFNILS
jgi:hypothetical protein